MFNMAKKWNERYVSWFFLKIVVIPQYLLIHHLCQPRRSLEPHFKQIEEVISLSLQYILLVSNVRNAIVDNANNSKT